MMEYGLSEEQKMIVETCRELAQEKILPIRAEYDEKNEFPGQIIADMAAADICGLYIDEQYNGMGGGVLEMCLAVEELSKVCGGIALAMAATALGTFPIILHGNDEQKKKYLPDIATGKKLAAFAITESEAGSDAGAIKTTAKKEGDHYILNGTKQWITNGGEAETYTVFAVTDKSKGSRGISAFILEKGMEGFEFGKKEDKLGIRASATRELIFQDCKVPEANRLDREGAGLIVAINTFNYSRPGVAAQALGIAAGALNEALEYSKTRVQFGKPISSFQAVKHMLADMATEVEAARCLLYTLCRHIDAGGKNFAKESAMVKMYASDVAMKVTTNAVQVLGGYGYMKEYPVEKMMRDAKITQIYEGTNQIQREEIGQGLIKETSAKK